MEKFTIFNSLAGIIPEPKYVSIQEGECKLSREVRLTTSNVQPLQRKTMRNLFLTAGIKVVANKKTYLVDATVDESMEIPAEVPEFVRPEYFEITLKGTTIKLRAVSQHGIIWGSSTLAGIYQSFKNNDNVPNMLIRDWPSTPHRGLFLRTTWLLGMMEINDWTMMGDIMTIGRFNQIFVELSSTPATELFAPQGNPIFLHTFNEDSKLHQLKIDFPRNWYSPRFDRWKSKKQYPFSVEKQNLGEILLLLRERGMTIIPTFSMYGGNQIIPQKAPKLAARRPRGGAKSAGLCYSNELTWKFLDIYFDDIFNAYFSGTPERVCIRLDDGFVDKDGSTVFCECKQCAARKQNARIEDFINLLKLIKQKGANEIVLTDSDDARAEQLLSQECVDALKREGLFDSVYLLQDDKTKESFGLKTLTNIAINAKDSYFYREHIQDLRQKINAVDLQEELFLALSYSPLEHEHILGTGEKLWHKESRVTPEILRANWFEFTGKKTADVLIAPTTALDKLVKEIPAEFFTLTSFADGIKFCKEHLDNVCAVQSKLEAILSEIIALQNYQDLPTNQRATYYTLRAHASLLLAYLTACISLAQEADIDQAIKSISENMEIAERVVPEWLTLVPFNGLSAILKELNPVEQEVIQE